VHGRVKGTILRTVYETAKGIILRQELGKAHGT
jgi:hypothetical protein